METAANGAQKLTSVGKLDTVGIGFSGDPLELKVSPVSACFMCFCHRCISLVHPYLDSGVFWDLLHAKPQITNNGPPSINMSQLISLILRVTKNPIIRP